MNNQLSKTRQAGECSQCLEIGLHRSYSVGYQVNLICDNCISKAVASLPRYSGNSKFNNIGLTPTEVSPINLSNIELKPVDFKRVPKPEVHRLLVATTRLEKSDIIDMSDSQVKSIAIRQLKDALIEEVTKLIEERFEAVVTVESSEDTVTNSIKYEGLFYVKERG